MNLWDQCLFFAIAAELHGKHSAILEIKNINPQDLKLYR